MTLLLGELGERRHEEVLGNKVNEGVHEEELDCTHNVRKVVVVVVVDNVLPVLGERLLLVYDKELVDILVEYWDNLLHFLYPPQ